MFLKDGSEQWLYIHIEIKGKREKNFAERMYIYNYRIFDRYRKEVISLTLLTDKYSRFRPKEYRRERWDFQLVFRYPMVKITDQRKRWAELEADPNPFALVVRAYLKAQDTHKNKKELYHWKKFFILEAYERGMKYETIGAIIRFIDWIMELPEELENEILDAVRTIEEAKKMPHMTSAERLGMKKGREEGMQQGMQRLVLRQMTARFGAIPEDFRQRIQAMKNAEKLEEIATRLVQVQSLDELKRFVD